MTAQTTRLAIHGDNVIVRCISRPEFELEATHEKTTVF